MARKPSDLWLKKYEFDIPYTEVKRRPSRQDVKSCNKKIENVFFVKKKKDAKRK